MSEFKFDRTKFKAQSAVEAANHKQYYQNLTWQQRLKVANYLNSIAYNYPENNPPRVNKMAYNARSLNNNE